ncbi:MAG: GAF domain-containing protein, partial [Anaerolineaceae bacterium]
MNIVVKTPPSDTTQSHKGFVSGNTSGETAHNEIVFRYLLQPIGHFQYISPNIAYLTGHAQTDYYKRPNLWVQCLHPDDQADQTQILLGKINGKNNRIRIQKPGYGYIWLEQKVTTNCDDEGQPLTIDATCQIQDEDHIRRISGDLSNPTITHLLDLSPLAICISSIDTQRIYFADQEFIRFLKFPLADLLDTKITELPIWRTSENRDFYKTIDKAQGNLTPTPMIIRAADGSDKHCLVTAQIVPYQDEPCFMTIFSDVTKQEEQKASLQSEHGALYRLIENSPLSINVADLSGKTVLWNRRSEQIFGWKAEEVLGKTMPCIEDYGEERYKKYLAELLVSKNWSGTDVRLRKKDGSQVVMCLYTSPVYGENGELSGVLGILADTTEVSRARMMQRALYSIASATSETQNLNALYKSIREALGNLIPVNNFFIALRDSENDLISYPYFVDEFDPPPAPGKGERGLTELVIRTGESVLADPQKFQELVQNGEIEEVGAPSIDWLGVPLKSQNRTIGAIAVQSYTEGIRFTEDHKNLLEFVSDHIAMAIERIRNEETIRVNERRYRGIIEDQTDLICRYVQDGSITFVNQAFCDFFEKDRDALLRSSLFELLPDNRIKRWSRTVSRQNPKHLFKSFESATTRRDGTPRWVQWKSRAIFSEDGGLIEIQSVGRDITEQQLRQREMDLISKITNATRFARSTSELLDAIVDQINNAISMDGLAFSLYESHHEGMKLEHGRGRWKKFKNYTIPLNQAGIEAIFKTRQNYINNKIAPDPERGDYEILEGLVAVVGIPLITEDKPIGILWLGKKAPITDEEIRLISAVVDITANGIHRVMLFEKTQERLRRLTTLKTIDLAITSTVDLKVILDILIDQIVQQLSVDAAVIWLYDPNTQLLEYRAGRGFQAEHILNYRLRMGESHAGKVALERKREIIEDLDKIKDSMMEYLKRCGVQFSSYIAIPLIAKGQVKGVLEIFTKNKLHADAEWLEFLDSLGGEAAIALDNATMFDRLQRSNIELGLAYDATIEGWARALEMRDQETIGHTRRVAELTIGLVMTLKNEDLDIEQIRRGVMLHDIGKMGIPDRILLKKGRLSPDEWKLMRMHPTYAYDMLHSVPNLRKLVDIPYCHHEIWDGSGYPRGLKEIEIPLATRIFTGVDVWDALRSDRPYRRAWSKHRALDFMSAECGKHFEPQLVNLFIENLPALI